MASNLDKRERYELLEGNFKLDHQPLSRTIRIYLSSEFTDTRLERSHVVKDVFPTLRSHCKSLGLQFYGVDLYGSIPSSLVPLATEEPSGDGGSNKHHQDDGIIYQLESEGTLQLALKEIKLCQTFSAGPNFVTLLAQRYGYKPLHSHILQEDFELLHAAIEESSARNLLHQWYLLDSNAQPPEYVLQSWNPEFMELSQWIGIHNSLAKTVRKAARVALGKDVSKVQHFVMSAVEEEITHGVFNLRQNPNLSCFWFKRVFTDLLDQRPSDASLDTYADMTRGRRGVEFDTETLKTLNHLKEARLPAKYMGLDSTNIFEFLIKWQRGKGLDPLEKTTHAEYLQELGLEMIDALKARISATAEAIESQSRDEICQEVMCHSVYCKKKATTFMDQPDITEKLYGYISSCSSVPLVVYGQTGCGKTQVMAGTAHKMREKFPLQKIILVTRFIGISPHSFSIRKILRSICEQLSAVLEEELNPIPGDFPSITAYFKAILYKATLERPIYILLDGVDQLSPEDGASGMSWLPLKLPPHVKIILSTSSDIKYRCYPVLQSLLAKHTENLIEVTLLTMAECRTLLTHQLSLRRRTLTSDQETALMMVLQRCRLPLYMDLILLQVHQWKSYFTSKPWEAAAPPITLKDITEKFFCDLEIEFGKIFFCHLAGFISATKHGLTEMELLDLMSCDQQVMEEIGKTWKKRGTEETSSQLNFIPAMLWSQVYHRLLPLTELNMGSGGCHVLQWSHRYFSEFAISRYLSLEDQVQFIYGSLADYFSGKCVHPDKTSDIDITSSPYSQPLLLNVEKNLYNVRKLSELPFCLARSGRKQELQELLSDYDWLRGKISVSSCADVVEEFSAVLPVVPLQRGQVDSASFYELRLLRDALSHSTKALNTDATQLPAQLYGRLKPFIMEGDTKRLILERLVMAALEDSQLLLIPLQPLQQLPGGPLLITMKGHRDAISGLAIALLTREQSGDPTLCIVSSSWDKTLKSWDLSTTGVLKTFDGHTDRVLCVALTVDGVYAASGSDDTTVRLWHVPPAQCLHVMSGHAAAVNAVVMTTDGSKTISGSSDGAIKVWNTNIASSSCGEIIFTMKNHRSPVLSMALSGDHLVASGAKNSVTLVTDIISGSVLHTFKGQSGPITAITMIQKESKCYLLTGGQDGTVTVWLMESGKLIHSLKRRGSGSCCVNNVAASNGDKVIASYENGFLSVWDLQSGGHLYDLMGQRKDSALALTVADQGNLVLLGGTDSSLQIWDMLSPPVHQDKQHESSSTSVSISPCSTYGVSGGEGSKMKLYDLEKIEVVGEIEAGSKGTITQVLVLRDSKRILVVFLDGFMQLWNGIDRELLVTFKGHGAAVNSVAVSPDSELLMSGSEDAKVVFWSIKTGTKLKTFHNHRTAVIGVAFSGDCMMSASRDGLVCVRDFHTAKITLSSTTHTDDLLCFTASPNSAFFLTGSRDKTCHVVDTKSGELTCMLRGHNGPVTCAKVLSNCAQCLTGSEDGDLRIWEVEGGHCVAMLCTDAPLVSCDISLKGDVILYGSAGGWVSSAVYRARERAKDLILQKCKGCKSPSDLSCTESESIVSTAEASQEPKKGESNDHEDTEVKNVSVVSGKTPGDQQNDAEQNETIDGLPEKDYPIDVDVKVIPNEQNLATEVSTQHKETQHLNGSVIETPRLSEDNDKRHEATLQEDPEMLSPEKIEIIDTKVENGNAVKDKVVSSVCLIL